METQTLLAIISVVLVLMQLPAWGIAIRMYLAMAQFKETKEDLGKFKTEVRKKFEAVTEDITEMNEFSHKQQLATAEIFGKINVTMTELNSSIKMLNEIMIRNEKHVETMVGNLYKDFQGFKQDVNKALDREK